MTKRSLLPLSMGIRVLGADVSGSVLSTSACLLLTFAFIACGQPPPSVTSIQNAAGIPQTVVCNPGCGSFPISANTWMTVYGTNLSPITRSWAVSDFINGMMPTSLSGVSVNLIGDYGTNNIYSAYVSFVSPEQINILTPANLGQAYGDDSTGYGLQVTIANSYGISLGSCTSAWDCPFMSTWGASPAFFLYAGTPYVIAQHADGSLIGPASAIPGATPAKPGETVVLYANGLGPTTGKIALGSLSQSGTLASVPAVTISSSNASVQFAGLISPGLYQVNVLIPQSSNSGNQPIAITVTSMQGGFSTSDTASPTTLLPIE